MVVFLVPISSGICSLVCRKYEVLTSYEREEILSIRNPQVQEQAIISKVMRRHLLSLFSKWAILPGDWDFGTTEHMKPIVANEIPNLDIHFNGSHCAKVFVLAVANGFELGIDIEPYGLRIDQKLAKFVFSDEEIGVARDLYAFERQQMYLRLWTLKEAFVKYLGLGVDVDLRTITTMKEKNAYTPVIRYRVLRDVEIRNVRICFFGGNYSLSIASRRNHRTSPSLELIPFHEGKIADLLFQN